MSAPAKRGPYEPRAPYCKGAIESLDQAMAQVQRLITCAKMFPLGERDFEPLAGALRGVYSELYCLQGLAEEDDAERESESGTFRKARRASR